MPGRAEGSLRQQTGAALLILLLLVTLTIGAVLLRNLSSAQALRPQRAALTSQALAEAKAALIAHAVTFGEMHPSNAWPPGSTVADDPTLPPGTLPCPDQGTGVGGEGAEASPCGATDVAAIGRFPWRALGTGPLRDGDGECLWYAVSGSFKANPPPTLLNADSIGQFRVFTPAGTVAVGATAETRAVALIFAPGAVLAGQDRAPVAGAPACGGNYAAANYLDQRTIAGTPYDNSAPNLTAGAVSDVVEGDDTAVNDRIATITVAELMAAINRRPDTATALYDASDTTGQGATPALAQKLAAMLARYGLSNADPSDHRLPWAAAMALGAFDNDSFDDIVGTYAGRPPYRVGNSRGATNNALVPAGCSSASDNCRLLIIERAGALTWWQVAGKPLDASGGGIFNSPRGWFDRWKDQYFYAVAPEFAPNSGIVWATAGDPCAVAGNTCIGVNGHRFAAVVLHAGAHQPGQSRATLADKAGIANYLEAGNDAAFAAPGAALARNFTATASDRLVCIVSATLAIDSTCTVGPP